MTWARSDDATRGGRWALTLALAVTACVPRPGPSTPSATHRDATMAPGAAAPIHAEPHDDSSDRGVHATVGNELVASWGQVQKALAEMYIDHPTTLYCGCDFSARLVDAKACGFESARGGKRAFQMEWEHVVPASRFGSGLTAWQDGDPDCVDARGRPFHGRTCAKRVSALYKRMASDMHNLYPSVGTLNAKRSDYAMGDVDGEPREFGACDFEVHDHRVEPRPSVRGEVARSYLYMSEAYPQWVVLTAEERKFFENWSAADPVDRWECVRARRITTRQGGWNAPVLNACVGQRP